MSNSSAQKKEPQENLIITSMEDFERVFFPQTTAEKQKLKDDPYKIGEKIVKSATEQTKAKFAAPT